MEIKPLPIAPVLIKLLQQVIYSDDSLWNVLLNQQSAVQEYFGKMGLALYLNETDGYAYLTQPESQDDNLKLPRLTHRHQLSLHQSLLLVLLRQRLLEFENSTPDAVSLILTQAEIVDMLRPFLRERNDERKLHSEVNRYLSEVEKMHLLRKIEMGDEVRYEVRRVIKAKIDSEKLAEMLERLQADAAQQE